MRSRARIVVAALALVLASGCGWWSEQGRTTKGAAYGTGAGAATGAAIGAALGGGEGAWKGAAVGAALGALGGGLIGHYMDNQAKEMQKVVDRQDRVERDGESLRLSLASDVLFDSGSATLQPGAEDKLQHVAEVLQRYPKTRVEIVGHTDNRGTSASNEKLADRRARAVRDVLVGFGVDRARITTRGAGETRPVATNDTLEGRVLNRRVEIVGHTDNRGTSASNEKLADRRARAVRDVLVGFGVDRARITTRGAGETRPVATNDTLEGRVLNRRVEIVTRPDETLAAESERQAPSRREAPPAEEPR
ncbi:MAG: hypothetical protein E6J79_01805 [Deltaproteobacteria bacterium]|nr:MAG: hypothetical protein E6J79_01805 [Deltaproteobacteria bacterium]